MVCLGFLSYAAAAMAAIEQSFAGEPELAPVMMMYAGPFHTGSIVGNMGVNAVKNLDGDGDGQLRLDDNEDQGDSEGDAGDPLPSVNLGEGLQAVDATAGLPHTAASLDVGTVSGRGLKGKRQLSVENTQSVRDGPNEVGNMPITQRGGLKPASISAGGWHTCAITDDKRLKCWGSNQWGELGLGLQRYRSGEPGEMRDNLPFVDLGDDIRVEHIALGDSHTCVISTDGDVKCFGKNRAGQLGYDDTNNRGDESEEMGNHLDKVYLGGKKATMVACGQEHTCAILEDGELRCWGLGASGQLGQGNRHNVGDTPGDMDKLVGIDLGSGRTAIEVVAGGSHTCALLDNDDVKCWGENDFGELGQGDTVYRGVAPNEMGDNLPPIDLKATWRVQSLSAGHHHTCAVLDEADAFGVVTESERCWGANFKGQIGLSILDETEKNLDNPHGIGDTLQSASPGGGDVDVNDDRKWYETILFIVAAAVAGTMICCCALCLCVRIQSDKSRRRIARPTPPTPQGVSGTSPDVETAVGRRNAAIYQGASGRPPRGYSVKRAAPTKENGTATVVGSPAGDVVAASAPPAAEGFAPATTVTAPAAVEPNRRSAPVGGGAGKDETSSSTSTP